MLEVNLVSCRAAVSVVVNSMLTGMKTFRRTVSTTFASLKLNLMLWFMNSSSLAPLKSKLWTGSAKYLAMSRSVGTLQTLLKSNSKSNCHSKMLPVSLLTLSTMTR